MTSSWQTLEAVLDPRCLSEAAPPSPSPLPLFQHLSFSWLHNAHARLCGDALDSGNKYSWRSIGRGDQTKAAETALTFLHNIKSFRRRKCLVGVALPERMLLSTDTALDLWLESLAMLS